MEIFGGVAAACTLGGEMLRIGRYLRKVIKSIKFARRDVSKTAQEMILFAELYQSFLDACINNSASDIIFSPKPLISWTRSVKYGLEELLKRVRALLDGSRYDYSLLETLAAHVKWYFSRSYVKYLRGSLNVARESINGFLNIWQLEKLDEQLRTLKQVARDGAHQALEERLGMTVEERIHILEQSIKTRRRVWREIDKRLQNAKAQLFEKQENSQKQDVKFETNMLLDFTENLEDYVEDILPRKGSNSRISTPNQTKNLDPNNVDPSMEGLYFEKSPAFETNRSKIQGSRGTKLKASTPPTQPLPGHETLPKKPSIMNPLLPTPKPSKSGSDVSSASHKIAKPTQVDGNQYKSNTPHSKQKKEHNNLNVNFISPRMENRYSTSPLPMIRRHMNEKMKWRESDGWLTRNEQEKSCTSLPRNDIVHNGKNPKDELDESSSMEKYEPAENESETEPETEGEDIDEGPSPFRPVAGFIGKYPPGWHQRHEVDE